MIYRDTIQNLWVASDHGGFELKEHLKESLPELCWNDLGCHSIEKSVDYPDFALALTSKIKPPTDIGLLICGSGQGMAIKANREKHIRAALCVSEEYARLARAHNDANVLCLGGRMVDFRSAERILLTFLDTPFEGGRHTARVEKLW